MTPARRKRLEAKLRALLEAPAAARRLEPNRTDDVKVGGDEDEQPLTEMLQAIASNRNAHDERVRARAAGALERLRRSPDDFGLCADCDEPIPPARLDAMPWAERCVACQAKAEPSPRATRRRPGGGP